MQHIRQAIRAVRVAPAVALVTVLSLTLGIGANTAIFSIIDALVLRELPVRDPEQLAVLTEGTSLRGQLWNYTVWDEIHRRGEPFAQSAAWAFGQFNLVTRGEARYIDGIYASGSFFDALGVPMLMGRGLRDADDRRGGGADGPVVVISHKFWQNEFAGR